MPHCTTDLAWYLGKFIIGFTGILFLYVNFLKENEKSCVCDIKMRELLREKSEKQPSKCKCTKSHCEIYTQNDNYLCECTKPVMEDDNIISTVLNEFIKHEFCPGNRRCRRNSC
ncbi:hypothetical protein P5V15_012994 [Pogonomyrmex californicus]